MPWNALQETGELTIGRLWRFSRLLSGKSVFICPTRSGR